LNPRKRNEVINALIRKGFIQSNKGHMKFQYFNQAGKKTRVWTKISRGTKHKEIRLNLAHMAKQCKLSNADFGKLLDCPLSREEYEDMLVETGVISKAT
jgi:predicted transcriptional regulator